LCRPLLLLLHLEGPANRERSHNEGEYGSGFSQQMQTKSYIGRNNDIIQSQANTHN